jgi:cell division septation protein DedD
LVLGHTYDNPNPNTNSILSSSQTASLGLFNGLNIPLPDLDNLPEEKSDDESEPASKSPPPEAEKPKEEEVPKSDNTEETKTDAPAEPTVSKTETQPKKEEKDWVVILGGASSVGKYAIQVSRQ